ITCRTTAESSTTKTSISLDMNGLRGLGGLPLHQRLRAHVDRRHYASRALGQVIQTFGMAYEEVAVRGEIVQQTANHLGLGLSFEVDQRVAAENQVKNLGLWIGP